MLISLYIFAGLYPSPFSGDRDPVPAHPAPAWPRCNQSLPFQPGPAFHDRATHAFPVLLWVLRERGRKSKVVSVQVRRTLRQSVQVLQYYPPNLLRLQRKQNLRVGGKVVERLLHHRGFYPFAHRAPPLLAVSPCSSLVTAKTLEED